MAGQKMKRSSKAAFVFLGCLKNGRAPGPETPKQPIYQLSSKHLQSLSDDASISVFSWPQNQCSYNG